MGGEGVTFCTSEGKDGIFCARISRSKAHFSDVTLKRSFTPLRRRNICIAPACFLTDSHPSVGARFVLLQTFPAGAHMLVFSFFSRTGRTTSIAPSIRGLAGAGRTEGERTCITIGPFTGDRNLTLMPRQWNHLYDGTEACLFEII